MAATAPPVITALPAPPDPNDRSTFNTRAYPWSVAQQTLATEVGAVAANVYANATEAADAAAIAVPAAAAAQAASNATQWVSGSTYAAGDVVWSPINSQSYRRKTAGAGTTDPSADTANWASLAGGTPAITRSARTSNIALAASDSGKLIDITSGTFTQTFDAAATLRDGWFCYLRNSGTGDITLDPNGSETIDGLTSYVMYPGECRLVQCDGTALRTVVLNAFYKTFDASGTFTKPPGYSMFECLLWGGGGGGTSSGRGGGGGGACVFSSIPSTKIASTTTVTIAATAPVGTDGSASTFAGVSAYGGGRGTQAGGGGGGAMGGGSASVGGAPSTQVGFGGVSGTTGAAGSNNIYGGASGGGWDGNATGFSGGSAIYGGGGGGGWGSSGALGGTSAVGGNGGAGGQPGVAPGGGGGGHPTTPGIGARGELRIVGVI